MPRVVHPDDGPGLMARPRQGDSSPGHMYGQIVGIACRSVGAHFCGHIKSVEREREGEKERAWGRDNRVRKGGKEDTLYNYIHYISLVLLLYHGMSQTGKSNQHIMTIEVYIIMEEAYIIIEE